MSIRAAGAPRSFLLLEQVPDLCQEDLFLGWLFRLLLLLALERVDALITKKMASAMMMKSMTV
jgi:hypothetical protein